MSDQHILDLIRTGKSDKALNTLYKHFPMMYKMISHHGGTRQDAEDIFQEALIILIRKARESDFQLTSKLTTWLFSVCRYLWKDELKGRKWPSQELDTILPTSEDEGLQRTIVNEHIAQLAEKALDSLQDRCRHLLIMFYESRLRLKDIAEKMGYSSENTAKNQKYKCLESAKNKLKELKQTSPTL